MLTQSYLFVEENIQMCFLTDKKVSLNYIIYIQKAGVTHVKDVGRLVSQIQKPWPVLTKEQKDVATLSRSQESNKANTEKNELNIYLQDHYNRIQNNPR